MSITATGHFFQDRILTPKALGAFGAAALRDGVLTGCGMSLSGTTLSVQPGYIIACGRVIQIASGSITVSGDGYVTAAITNADRAETSGGTTVTIGFQASEPAANTDINLTASSYTCAIAKVSGGAVTPISAVNEGTALTRLWYNTSSPLEVADGEVVTGIDFSTYSWFYILFQRYPKSAYAEGKSVYGQLFYIPQDSTEYDLMKTSASDTESYSNGIYYRSSLLVQNDATGGGADYVYSRGLTFFRDQSAIMFHQGRYRLWSGGQSTANAGAHVPILIYGVR